MPYFIRRVLEANFVKWQGISRLTSDEIFQKAPQPLPNQKCRIDLPMDARC